MQSGLWARFIRMLWHLNDLVFLGLLDPELVAVSWYRARELSPHLERFRQVLIIDNYVCDLRSVHVSWYCVESYPLLREVSFERSLSRG